MIMPRDCNLSSGGSDTRMSTAKLTSMLTMYDVI